MNGLLLIDKPAKKTSFYLVGLLRKLFQIKKIGHAGTLDPFATGVMVMMIGRDFTKLSDSFLNHDKEYEAQLLLGQSTDTYDCDGQTVNTSSIRPSLEEIQLALKKFQGHIEQIPPMFSAKKIGGKKLYELARKGQTIERKAEKIEVCTTFISYEYPYLKLHVTCSKGTYIRSIAHDLGQMLGCYAHLTKLIRLRSGPFQLKDCFSVEQLLDPNFSAKSLQLNEQLCLIPHETI